MRLTRNNISIHPGACCRRISFQERGETHVHGGRLGSSRSLWTCIGCDGGHEPAPTPRDMRIGTLFARSLNVPVRPGRSRGEGNHGRFGLVHAQATSGVVGNDGPGPSRLGLPGAFAAVAIGGLLIASTDQARDIVIATASPQQRGLPIPLTVLLWAVTAWYWSRITLEFLEGRTGEVATTGRSRCRGLGWAPRWHRFWNNNLPRLIGAAAIFSVCFAFWRAHNIYAAYGDFESAKGFLRPAIAYLVATVVFYFVVAWRRELAAWLVRAAGGDPDRSKLVPRRQSLQAFAEIAPLTRALLYGSVLASPVFFLLFAMAPSIPAPPWAAPSPSSCWGWRSPLRRRASSSSGRFAPSSRSSAWPAWRFS